MIPWDEADPVGWGSRVLANCGVSSPRLESQLLLALTLGTTRTAIAAGLHATLSEVDALRFQNFVDARCRRNPLAYLRGSQDFYSLEFEVTPDVLIPRPETELLVDFAREALASEYEQSGFAVANPIVADVGTGSGCIAIAMLASCPSARGIAFDLSPRALDIALRNARRHDVTDRLRFVQGDLMSAAANGRYPLILSNPPYIAASDIENLQPEVRDAEPRIALVGGEDGLDAYRRLAPQAARALVPGGRIAVEIGQGQAADVRRIFAWAGLDSISVRRDLAGIERVVIARRPCHR